MACDTTQGFQLLELKSGKCIGPEMSFADASWNHNQDTLIAIEALSEFAYRETNRDFYKMTIYMEGTARDWGVFSMELNKTNFADLHMLVVSVDFSGRHAAWMLYFTRCAGRMVKSEQEQLELDMLTYQWAVINIDNTEYANI